MEGLNTSGSRGRWLRRVVQGYFNYHAVPGNLDRVDAFRKDVSRAWFHALRRRGSVDECLGLGSGVSAL